MLGDGASILRMTFRPSILGEASRGNAAPGQASSGECGNEACYPTAIEELSASPCAGAGKPTYIAVGT